MSLHLAASDAKQSIARPTALGVQAPHSGSAVADVSSSLSGSATSVAAQAVPSPTAVVPAAAVPATASVFGSAGQRPGTTRDSAQHGGNRPVNTLTALAAQSRIVVVRECAAAGQKLVDLAAAAPHDKVLADLAHSATQVIPRIVAMCGDATGVPADVHGKLKKLHQALEAICTTSQTSALHVMWQRRPFLKQHASSKLVKHQQAYDATLTSLEPWLGYISSPPAAGTRGAAVGPVLREAAKIALNVTMSIADAVPAGGIIKAVVGNIINVIKIAENIHDNQEDAATLIKKLADLAQKLASIAKQEQHIPPGMQMDIEAFQSILHITGTEFPVADGMFREQVP